MKKGIFKRIFLLYAIILLAAVIFIEIHITTTVKENYINTLRNNLSVQINLISKSISFRQGNLDNFCKLLKKDSGARITVISNDGTVIGDSDSESALMDNHLHRTEIEQANLFDTGMAIRYSDTLKYDFLYVAKRIFKGDIHKGFIRIAVPLNEVYKNVNFLRMKLIFTVVIILLCTWVFSIWQIDHIRRLLSQITTFSNALARGEINRRLFLKNAGEFNVITDNLISMSDKLHGLISHYEEERNRLNVILKSVPDALLIIDTKGIITLSSSSAQDLFGSDNITGMSIIEVVRNHTVTDMIECVQKNLSPVKSEFRTDTPAERYLSVRVSPLFYMKNVLSGFVAVFHDITEMKRLEQIRKDFVANVSHELKTPITSIKGFADTLLEGALDDKETAIRFIQTIRFNSERINNIVDDLMTISKIELGVIKVEKTMFNINDVFNSLFEIFRNKAFSKGLSLNIKNMASITEINGDRNRLIQILTNLLDNAIKFTEHGEVTLGIDQTEGRPFIFVEDTGIGIPAKHLPRLGERFYRVDPARSRKLGGTGLGLAIVKHLVKAHNWKMKIESNPGKGTNVKIII